MQPHGVLETSLYVPDLDRAARFYHEVLGLRLHSRVRGRHVFLRCGNGMLLLFDPDATSRTAADVPTHGCTGPGHAAFAVRDDEIDAWRSHLDAAGVPIETEMTWPAGARSLYFRDPAGNCLELASPSIWDLAEPPPARPPHSP